MPCTAVCIGRDSLVAGMERDLRAFGYELRTVGSLHEYLEFGKRLGEHLVLISENFDSSARESIAYWVRRSARQARIIFLYTHYIDRVRGADAVADAGHLRNVLDALAFVFVGSEIAYA